MQGNRSVHHRGELRDHLRRSPSYPVIDALSPSSASWPSWGRLWRSGRLAGDAAGLERAVSWWPLSKWPEWAGCDVGADEVEAHDAKQTHHYVIHYPSHEPRASDPHYVDFEAYHRKTRATARCFVGERIGYGDCKDAQGHPCPPPSDNGPQRGLELHHAVIEFSLQNGVDLAWLEKDYPGISDPSTVGAWVESATNLRWLCAFHHRGSAGAHVASHSDWSAGQYIPGLIS